MIQDILREYASTIAKFQRLWVRGEIKVTFYSTWLFGVLVLFGVFGIAGLIASLRVKDGLIEKLLDVNGKMEKNILELRKAEGLIASSKTNIGYFEKRMPNEINEEAYLKEVYLTCIQSNYTLTSLTQGGIDPGTGEISAGGGLPDNEIRYFLKARGSTSPDNLINNLEKLQRVTYVRKISFEEKNKIYTVAIDLSAFYTKEEAL